MEAWVNNIYSKKINGCHYWVINWTLCEQCKGLLWEDESGAHHSENQTPGLPWG